MIPRNQRCAQCKAAPATERLTLVTHHKRDNGGEPYTKEKPVWVCSACASVMRSKINQKARAR